MGKREISCPYCGKKVNVTTGEISEIQGRKIGDLKEIKGADWYPLMKPIGHNEWHEDWTLGVGIECKCKRAYFVKDIQDEDQPLEASSSLFENTLLPWFCEPCGAVFTNPDMKCPTCGRAYAGGV